MGKDQDRKNRLREQRAQNAPRQETVYENPLDSIAGDAALAEMEEAEDIESADGGAIQEPEGGSSPVTEPNDGSTSVEAEDGEEDEEQPSGEDEAYERMKAQLEELRINNEAAERKAREAEERRQRAEQERLQFEQQYREQQRRAAEIQAAKEKQELEDYKRQIEFGYGQAESEVKHYKKAYAEAMANLDYEAAAEAQYALAETANKITALREGYSAVTRQIANYKPPQIEETPRPAAPVQQQAPQADDPFEARIAGLQRQSDKDFLRRHKDRIMAAPEKNERLLGAKHWVAVDEHGLEPGSQAYYDFMEESMGWKPQAAPAPQAASQGGQIQQQAKPQARRNAPVPAAPVSRGGDAGGIGDADVRLTREEKDLARSMGMSFAKYAKHKQDIAAGKYNYKFSE